MPFPSARPRRPAARNRVGLGLIELLVVIVIIALLALFLLPRILGTGGKKNKDGTRTPVTPMGRAKQAAGAEYVGQINQAITMYRMDNDNANPASLQDLKKYGVTDEMLVDPLTKAPLAYDPSTGAVGGKPTAPLAPGASPPPANSGDSGANDSLGAGAALPRVNGF